MDTNQDAGGQVTPPEATATEPGRDELVRAWVAVAISLTVVLAAMTWGPRPGDSVVVLVLELAVVGTLGLGGAIAAIVFAVRALRLGRNLAAVPLVIAAFLVFRALLTLLGTLGRFYGWG